MGRARNGTVEPIDGGRWSVRITTPTGERRRIGVHETREEADRARVALVEAMAGGGETRGPTLAEFAETWFERRKGMRSWPTQERVWKARIATAPWYERDMRQLRRSDVSEWIRESTGARSTKKNALNLLRTFLTDAIEAGFIKANPTSDIRVPKESRTSDPWTWLRPYEVDTLLSTALESERDVLAFAVGSGLRAGELASLEWADVRDDEMIVRYGGRGHKPTKGGRPRVVPLFGMARQAIERQRARQAGPLVWPAELGGPRVVARMLGRVMVLGTNRPKVYIDRYGILCAHAGLLDTEPDRPLVWHSLRHTCASLLVSGAWGRAWSLREVQELLGHTKASTTERYAHLSGTLVQRAAAEHDGRNVQKRPVGQRSSSHPRDLNPRPAVYETAPRVPNSSGFGASWAIVDATRRAVAEGLPVAGDLARVLATSVIGQGGRTTELAVAVLSGGPHAVSRALDLADHLETEHVAGQAARAVTG